MEGYMVGGHLYCCGCFHCEESPCLGDHKKAGATPVDTDEGCCRCCGESFAADADTAECGYCAVADRHGDEVPPVDDDDRWADLATEISLVTYRWDAPAGSVEAGWYAEAWDGDRMACDSQKVWFPVDVDGYGEDDGRELEAALKQAFPNAEID